MRTICIVFCDSSFGNTFRNLLDTIYNVNIYLSGVEDLTQDHIKYCIIEGIEFHYKAFQHFRKKYWYKDPIQEAKSVASTVEYLKKKVKVLFDDEAEKFIQDHDHDSGSWFLEVATGKVYSF